MSHNLKTVFLCITVLVVLCIPVSIALCGCKRLRMCYQTMLDDLLEAGEEPCVENAPVGQATTVVYLRALQSYCGHIVHVNRSGETSTGKGLYEVVINATLWGNDTRKVIILDAGQDSGEAPVGFALFLIEQLVACIENADLLQDVRWVILPSTNPDGLAFNRGRQQYWKKNTRKGDGLTFGVDITRNFDDSWNVCPANKRVFSHDYPGEKPISENETIFITDVLNKYKDDAKAYVSFRRDGHAILYPYSSVNSTSDRSTEAQKIAGIIAEKVNRRPGLQWFHNTSIISMNSQAQCGHSVDYAFNKLSIPNAFEMRIFLESNNEIISKLQTPPKGYEVSLRNSYFNGIKELYNLVSKHE